jgi:hypothetical protein
MSIFRRLRDIFAPPPPTSREDGFLLPAGISASEWSAIKDLMEEPGWDAYLKLLDDAANFSAEAILAASQDESLHFHRGIVVGIRKAASLPREAVASETRWKDDQLAAERRRNTDSGGRAVALFGSPAWKQPREHSASGR